MEVLGEYYIARNIKREDFQNLALSIDSKESVWKTAIDIFNARIEGRFFNQIRVLLGNGSNEIIDMNGFAITALECLLIETLAQFFFGVNTSRNYSKANSSGRRTGRWNSTDCYIDFLKGELPEIFSASLANDFYTLIRCGILHSAQTKPGSCLSCQTERTVWKENEMFFVSVVKLAEALYSYFDEYKKRLLDPLEQTLRENFIKKMNSICIR